VRIVDVQGVPGDGQFVQLLQAAFELNTLKLFNDKLREWEDFYNYHRPHGSLDGQAP
jgi:transposase InsO family protein